MRALFVETLKAKGVKQDFSFIKRQNGMFSFSGLTKEQVQALRDRHAIYAVASGRINVAGMTKANMDRFAGRLRTSSDPIRGRGSRNEQGRLQNGGAPVHWPR